MALVEEVEGLPKVDVNIPLSDLIFEKKISKGGFGEVWKASYFGTDVAVKKMLRPDDSFIMRLIQREISALKEVRHPNICLFLGVCLDDSQINVVTEYIDGGTLWKLLKNRGKSFPWLSRLHAAVEIAKAMTFLHAKSIAHRDLKSDNVLLDKNMHPKICDFGLARGDMKDTATKYLTKAGTETWMAPEIILGDAYSLKADVFSFGVVLYELIVRDRPVDRSPMDAYQFQYETFGKFFPPDTPPELASIAIACVSNVPEERPAFKDILPQLKDMHIKMKEEAKAARPPKPINQLPPPLEVPSSLPTVLSPPPPMGLTSNLMPPPPPVTVGPWAPPSAHSPVAPPPPSPLDAFPPSASPGYVDSTKLAKKKKRRTATASEHDLPVPISELVLPPSLSTLPPLISPAMSPLPPAIKTKSNPSSPRTGGTPPNNGLLPPASPIPSPLPSPLPTSPLPSFPSLLPPPDFSSTLMMPTTGSDSGTPVKARSKSPSRRSATPDSLDAITRPQGQLSSSTSKIKPRKTRTPSKRRLSVEIEGQALPPPLDSSSAEMSDDQTLSATFGSLPPPPMTILSPVKKLRSSAPTSTSPSEFFLPPPINSSSSTRDPSAVKKRKSRDSRDKNDPTHKSSKEAE